MKVSPGTIRPFLKAGPRKTGGRKHAKSRNLTDTSEKYAIENQRARKGKKKYSGKTLEKKTVKNFITVDSYG